MQLGGIGGEHPETFHQVTECLFDHKTHSPHYGGSAGEGAALPAAERTVSQQTEQQTGRPVGWLRSVLNGGRRLLGRIWGESGGSTASGKNGTETASSAPVQPAESELARAAAQTALMPGELRENPYFTPAAQGSRPQSAWEKAKVRFRAVAGQLERRFPGKESCRSRQQRPEKELKRRSRYQGADEQIDCILTDDSYLMDSYDRNGGYTKLTTRK